MASLLTLVLSSGRLAMAEDIQLLSGSESTATAGLASASLEHSGAKSATEPVYYIDESGACQQAPATTDISELPSGGPEQDTLQSGWYVMGEGRDFPDNMGWREKRAERGVKTYLTIAGDVSMVVAPERLHASGCTIKVNEGATLKLYALASAQGTPRGVDDDSVKHNPIVVENSGALEISGAEGVVYHLGVDCMDNSSLVVHSGRIDGTVGDDNTVVVHKGAEAKFYGGSIPQVSTDEAIHVQGAPVIDCVRFNSWGPLVHCDGPFEEGASIGVGTLIEGSITRNYGIWNMPCGVHDGPDPAADAFIHSVDNVPLTLDEGLEVQYDAYIVRGEGGLVSCPKDEAADISDPSFKFKSVPSGYDKFIGGWYVVKGNCEFANRIAIAGDVNLILCDGATAKFKKGIDIRSNKFTIYGMSNDVDKMGRLIAKGDADDAGIGSGFDGGNEAEIVIYGGKIEAEGGSDAAGIGGGSRCGCGKIKIHGGHVTAEGGDGNFYWPGGGSGIGSGDSAREGGDVEITGGVVIAKGGDYGAGIGTGDQAKATLDINISGGDVTATSGEKGAGIGGGNETNGGHIYISGGTVNAKGVDGDGAWDWAAGTCGGAGIGGGDEGDAGNIEITGGNVTASAKGEKACAIGRGDGGEHGRVWLAGFIKVVGNEGKTLTGNDRYGAIKSWHWVNTMPID